MRTTTLLAAAFVTAATLMACGGDELVSQRANAIRPTDGEGWAGNGYGDVEVESWDTPGGRFRIHYTRLGYDHVQPGDDDNDGTPDFVQQFGLTFDTVLARYRDELGFREPLSDELYHDRPDYGGDDRFDVYLLNQNGSSDGYLVAEACTNSTPTTCAGYMVVENDFEEYHYASDQEAMEILASHEFFHAVQAAYVRGLGQSFSEGSAVWGTEEVFPETSDFEGFIRYFFQQPHRPIDDVPSSQTDLFSYSTAIWPRFLSERFGADMIAGIFEELASGGAASALDAVDNVLKADHQSNLALAFGEFTLWNLFTGDRAREDFGYQNAASYPQLTVEEKSDPLPYRISGEISYLAGAYYHLAVPADHELTVTVEYETPKLVLHLITGSLEDPTIVTSEPEAQSLSIVTQGDVYLVAASTTRADKHQALSLAITSKPVKTEPTDPTDPTDPIDPKEDGGCSVAGSDAPYGAALALLPLALIVLLRRRNALVAMSLVVGLALGACSDDDGPAADTLVVDAGPDTLAPDTGPDAEMPLALGRFVDFPANADGQIHVDIPVAGDEEMMLLLISNGQEAALQHDYSVVQSRAADISIGPAKPEFGHDEAHDARRCTFHQRLTRALQDAQLPLRMPHRYKPFADAKPEVGDVRSFTIRGAAGPEVIDAEAVYVDDVAVFWLDKTTEPLASIEETTLAELAAGFSEIIVPRERIFFGEESDINGDGLISVMLSPLTNVDGASAYVSLCDLTEINTIPGCSFSNSQELLYLTPPNLVMPPYNTPRALLETAAHEFQHAIFFYRKYLLNEATDLTANPYITEGLSHLAQDLSGYAAGNFFVLKAAIEAVDVLSVPNIIHEKIASYVPQPEDGYLRGGGYLFFRYLFDRAGGESVQSDGTPVDEGGISFLNAFIDQPESGIEGTVKASGLDYIELVNDFWTALALSNREHNGGLLTEDPRYSFRPTTVDPLTERTRGCNLFSSFHGMALTGPTTQALSSADGKLRPGGAELLTFRPQEGATRASVTLKTDPASKAMVRLIRVR